MKKIIKKYYGGYEICEAMGLELDYQKITNFLNLINAPMTINKRGIKTYALNNGQVEYLTKILIDIKRDLRKITK